MEVDTNLILIVLFWIAPAIVIIFNLLWDIDFLQRKEYGLHRIYQTLRWDSEFTHRGRFQLILKLALFAAVASFVFARSNIVPAVATLLAFAWWINEVFEVITKLASKQRPRPRLDIRGVAILYLSVMLLAIIPITIAASLPSTPTSLTKLVISSAGEILPVETASGTVIPAAYAALIFSALLALAYDLAAPFIVVTMTILTLPFAWLRGRFIIWRVQRKLASIKPTVIVIAASANHPHIRPLLSKLVGAGTITASLPDVETTPRGLARSLRGKLQSDTAVVIAELGAWRTGDMYRLCKVVNPDISILPGIDDSHIGTFGTIDLTLDAKLELIRGTKPTGTVIFNADDELVSSLVRTTNHKEIICTEHKHRLGEFSDNQLTIDHYLARHMKDATVIEHAAGKLAIGGIDKDAGLDLAMAIAAAAEAGTALDSAPATLQGFPIQKLTPLSYEGDLRTTIWDYPMDLRYRQFLSVLDFIKSLPSDKQRIIITKGVTDLGRYKEKVHAELAGKLNSTIDVLITPDAHLAASAAAGNTRTQIFHIENISAAVYKAREVMQPEANIVLTSELPGVILQQLRSELR